MLHIFIYLEIICKYLYTLRLRWWFPRPLFQVHLKLEFSSFRRGRMCLACFLYVMHRKKGYCAILKWSITCSEIDQRHREYMYLYPMFNIETRPNWVKAKCRSVKVVCLGGRRAHSAVLMENNSKACSECSSSITGNAIYWNMKHCTCDRAVLHDA